MIFSVNILFPTVFFSEYKMIFKKKISISKVFVLSFLLLVFLSALLPKGSLFGFPIRTLLLLLCFTLFLFQIVSAKKIPGDIFKDLVPYLSIFVLSFIWISIGVFGNTAHAASSISQFLAFVITFSIPLLAIYLYKSNQLSAKRIIQGVVYGYAASAIIKVLMVVLIFTGFVEFSTLFNSFKLVFGFEPVTQLISAGIIRFQYVNDVLAPIVLLLCISNYGGFQKNKHTRLFLLSFIVLCWLLSFSRTLLALGVMSIIFGAILCRKSVRRSFYFTFFLLLISVFSFKSEYITEVVDKRFFSSEAVNSDHHRITQFESLIVDIDVAPFLGRGTGARSKDILRNKEKEFSYEMQLLALFMQIGFLGVGLILLSLLFTIRKYFKSPFYIFNSVFIASYLIFILSCFTNPYMFSMSSGLVFMIYSLISFENEKKLLQKRYYEKK
ncbi:MAG: hypothetical protein ACJAXS_001411 [Colwellia sp.]|jgi:hypothetical protein